MCLLYYLNLLTTLIVEKYFSNSCTMFITNNTINFLTNRDILSLNSNYGHSASTFFKFGCKNFVLLSNDTEKIIDFVENNVKFAEQRFNNRKYLILLPDRNDTIEKIGNFVPDLLTVTVKKIASSYNTCDVIFALSTHKFVGLNGNNDMKLLDIWFSHNNSFLYGNDLFPNKLGNMELRQLKIATFNYTSYVVWGK